MYVNILDKNGEYYDDDGVVDFEIAKVTETKDNNGNFKISDDFRENEKAYVVSYSYDNNLGEDYDGNDVFENNKVVIVGIFKTKEEAEKVKQLMKDDYNEDVTDKVRNIHYTTNDGKELDIPILYKGYNNLNEITVNELPIELLKKEEKIENNPEQNIKSNETKLKNDSTANTKQEIIDILQTISKNTEYPVYAVGGAVRDTLKNKDSKDIDLVFKGPVEDLESALKKSNLDFKRIDPKSTLPIYAFQFGDKKIEITLPRKEQKNDVASDNPHKQFDIIFDHNISLEDDAKRRDFTINAIYMDKNGQYIYPIKQSEQDIQNNKLRECSDAFKEDPLRVIRALRFTSQGYEISNQLKNFIETNKTELVNGIEKLPVERISGEMLKAFKNPNTDNFFKNYMNLNLDLTHLHFINEMNETPAGPEKYHGKETTLEHSLNVMNNCTNPDDKITGFFHDIGKIETPKDKLPNHFGHDAKGAEMIPKILNDLKLPLDNMSTMQFVTKNHMIIGFNYEHLQTKTKLDIIDQGIRSNSIEALIDVVSADHPSFSEQNKQEIQKIAEALKQPVSKYIDPKTFEGKSNEYIIQKVREAKINIVSNIEKQYMHKKTNQI